MTCWAKNIALLLLWIVLVHPAAHALEHHHHHELSHESCALCDVKPQVLLPSLPAQPSESLVGMLATLRQPCLVKPDPPVSKGRAPPR